MFGLKRKLATTRIEVRTARPDDLGAILAIEHGSGLSDPWDERAIAATLKHPESTSAVAIFGGAVAGWACGAKQAFGEGWEITDLVVLPEYRRRGVGRMLVAFMQIAAFRDLTLYEARRLVMCATTLETNTGGLSFLAACGFAFPKVLTDMDDPGRSKIRQSWRPPADDLGCTGWVEGVA